MMSANPPLLMISLIQLFGNIRAANTGLIPRGLLKFSEFSCLSPVYEMSDANENSE